MTPTFLILLGTVLIAVGGVVATYGWNLRSSLRTSRMLEESRARELETKRGAMVRTAMAELLMNVKVISNPIFHEEDESKLSEFVVLPRFHTEALAAMMASGLFLEERDRALFTRVADLLSKLHDCNRRMATSEQCMQFSPKEKIAEVRRQIREGRVLRDRRAELVAFGRLLMTQYGIAESDEFFVDINSLEESK